MFRTSFSWEACHSPSHALSQRRCPPPHRHRPASAPPPLPPLPRSAVLHSLRQDLWRFVWRAVWNTERASRWKRQRGKHAAAWAPWAPGCPSRMCLRPRAPLRRPGCVCSSVARCAACCVEHQRASRRGAQPTWRKPARSGRSLSPTAAEARRPPAALAVAHRGPACAYGEVQCCTPLSSSCPPPPPKAHCPGALPSGARSNNVGHRQQR